MGDRQELKRYEENTTNPAPLGLVGFGMTTLLLNLHNIGLFEMDTMIMAMGIFFGGIAQAIVGKMEWKKNNMFGMVAFSSYGFFWIILVLLMVLPKLGIGEAPSKLSMGWFLGIWGVLSLGLWVATFKLAKMMRVLFGTVVLLFFLLAASDFLAAAGNPASGTMKIIGGIDGVICGSIALYIAIAMVINDTHCKEVLPLA
jgi:uncharacterized protein